MNNLYSITCLSHTANTVNFQYTCPDNSGEKWEWWALYEGAVPEYKDLGKYLKWGWICPEKKGCESSGTKTVEVGDLTSGATYSLALFKWRWDVVDSFEFTVEPQYELKRQVLCLNRLCDWLLSSDDDKNTRDKLMEKAKDISQKVLADDKVNKLIGQWNLVWGPFVYKHNPNEKSTKADNIMFVVKKHNTSQYLIAISGNKSNYGMVNECLEVNELEDWVQLLKDVSIGELNISEDLSRIKISQGTSTGLHYIINKMGHEEQQPNLIELLQNLMKNHTQEEVEIIVTGHSLGGALSPGLALALIDLQNQWNPTGNAKVFALPTAGATSGNHDFALRYNQKLEKSSRDKLGANRIWNQLDVAPYTWETDMLQEVPSLYKFFHTESKTVIPLVVQLAYAVSINFIDPKLESKGIFNGLNWQEFLPFLTHHLLHKQSPYEQICKKTAESFSGKFNKSVLSDPNSYSQVSEPIADFLLNFVDGFKGQHENPEQHKKHIEQLKPYIEKLIALALESIKSADDSTWKKNTARYAKELSENYPFLKSGILTGIEDFLEAFLEDLLPAVEFFFQGGYQHVIAYEEYFNIPDFLEELSKWMPPLAS